MVHSWRGTAPGGRNVDFQERPGAALIPGACMYQRHQCGAPPHHTPATATRSPPQEVAMTTVAQDVPRRRKVAGPMTAGTTRAVGVSNIALGAVSFTALVAAY